MDERGFYMILPSNVQPDLHQGNTASNYQTTFPSTYSLPGEWEVALTEVSYVNTMPTIIAETFDINSSKLEADAITHIFNVEGELYMPRSVRMKRESLLRQKKEENEKKKKTADSKKSKLQPVAAAAAAADRGGEKREPTGLEGMVSINKFTAKYPNQCPFTMKFDKATKRLKITAKEDLKPNVYLYKAEADQLKLAHPQGRIIHDGDYKQLWVDTLKKGESYISHGQPSTLTGAVTVSFKIQDTRCLTVNIPKGYYPDPLKLVEALNQETENPLASWEESEKSGGKKACGYRFGYSKSENRIVLGLTKYTDITFYNNLHYILGFAKTHYKGPHTRLTAESAPTMHQGIFHLYIYCDLCAPIRVGNMLVPLLRSVEVPSGEKWGKVTSVRFQRPMYLPLTKSCINSVKIELFDDTGHPIQFQEGRTVATLHIRPRKL